MLIFKQCHFFELTYLLIQLLQPSRFLREIPDHLLEVQVSKSNTFGSSFTKSNPCLKTCLNLHLWLLFGFNSRLLQLARDSKALSLLYLA
jgi:hypothetical protein